MKLSLAKRYGMVHVRAKRLVRVLVPHAVNLKTRDVGDQDAKPEERVAWSKEGDLAIEIEHVTTGKVVGYSYLTGPAIAAIRYDHGAGGVPIPAEWFGEATIARLEIPWLLGILGRPNAKPDDEALERAGMAILGARYGTTDLSVFEYLCGRGENYELAGKRFCGLVDYSYQYQPADGAIAKGHVLAIVRGRKKGVAFLDIQPEHHAQDLCAAPFQFELALSLTKEFPCSTQDHHETT